MLGVTFQPCWADQGREGRAVGQVYGVAREVVRLSQDFECGKEVVTFAVDTWRHFVEVYATLLEYQTIIHLGRVLSRSSRRLDKAFR